MQLPQGWIQHPQNPAYAYHQQTNEVRTVQELTAPPPPQAPPPVPQQQPVQQAPGAWGEASIEAMQEDLDAAKQAQEQRQARRGNREDEIYLDFPEFPQPRNKGDKVDITVRLLPPWRQGVIRPYIKIHMLYIPSWLWPEQYDGKALPVVSYETESTTLQSPGPDPIQHVINKILSAGPSEETAATMRRMRTTKVYWQGYDYVNPDRHWIQRKDDNGNVVQGPNGPEWIMKPGVVTMKNSLHLKVLDHQARGRTNVTVPSRGRPVQLIKEVTGPLPQNISYDCYFMDPEPIPEQIQHALLPNLIDLEARYIRFKSRDLMEKAAQMIWDKFGSGGAPVSAQVPAQVQVQRPQAPVPAPAPQQQASYPQSPQYHQPPQQQPVPAPVPQYQQPPVAAPQPPPAPPAPPAPAAPQYPPQGGPPPPPVAPAAGQPPAIPSAPVPAPAAPPGMPAAVPPTTQQDLDALMRGGGQG